MGQATNHAKGMPGSKSIKTPFVHYFTLFSRGLCREPDESDGITTFRLFSEELALGLQTCLNIPQPLVQKADFSRIADGPAGQEPADHDPRGLQFVHVLQDEDFHLLRPQGHIGAVGVLLDGGGVAPGQGQILQAMLRDGGGVCQPGPAAVRVVQELPIDEFEHQPGLGLIRDIRIQTARSQKWVLTSRVQPEDPQQPLLHGVVVQGPKRDAIHRLVVEALQVEHQQLRKRDRVATKAEISSEIGSNQVMEQHKEAFDPSTPIGAEVAKILGHTNNQKDILTDVIELAKYRIEGVSAEEKGRKKTVDALKAATAHTPGAEGAAITAPPSFIDMPKDQFEKEIEKVKMKGFK